MGHPEKCEAQHTLITSPVVGQVYQHYKGGHYVVTGITIDEATARPRVSYRSLTYTEYLYPFSRPLAEWLEEVLEEGPEGRQVLRYVPVREAATVSYEDDPLEGRGRPIV